MARRLVTVFGGTGFIGRHLVSRLAARGWVVRVAVRHPAAAEFLQPMGDVAQIVPVRADVTDENLVRLAVADAEAVVNLVGILYETRHRSFEAIHVGGAGNVAVAAKAAGVGSLVHISALGADGNSPAAYARTKAAGEEAVLAAFPGATIIRPSVVFGREDDFFNRFARLSRLSPILPVFTSDGFRARRGGGIDLFGSGGPRFQPVFVGDVAAAIVTVIEEQRLAGKIYELGGPRSYSLKEIMELVLKETGRHRPLVPVPFAVAMAQAAFLEVLPTPPLTRDQVRLMQSDNVVSGERPGLSDLGITPNAVEAILPTYLAPVGKRPLP